MSELQTEKIIYKELSYKLMGILFSLHRSLGNRHQEKHYQRAIEVELDKQGIPFEREFLVSLDYEDNKIGRYYLDFVIDNKIALEIKTVPFIKQNCLAQTLAYLDSANLKLGIVANFRTKRLTYKRLINPRVKLILDRE